MRFLSSLVVSIVVLFAAAAPARSQTASPTAPAAADNRRLTAEESNAAIAEIERLVGEHYFEASKRPAVLAALAEGRRSGRYRGTTAVDFVRLVTEDLRRTSNDRHMYLTWNPQGYRVLLERARAPATGARNDSYFQERFRRENHGLQEMKILPGNVRYLKIAAGFGTRRRRPPPTTRR
jgi:hypothetical protein